MHLIPKKEWGAFFNFNMLKYVQFALTAYKSRCYTTI